MTRSLMYVGLVTALALGLAGQAMGEDVWDPPWDLTLPNQTTEIWECAEGIPLDVPIPPTIIDNPFGDASVTLIGEWNFEWAEGPNPGMEIPTWHVGPGGGSIEIKIKNNEDPLKYKKVFWQITSDKSVTPTGSPPTSNPPGTHSTPYPAIQWPNGSWYTYNGLVVIQPNPAEETITFPDLVECTNISEIVVKTICVPEPATMTLLAFGACLPLLRRRRK